MQFGEAIAIVSVGVGLLTLIVGVHQKTGDRIRNVEAAFNEKVRLTKEDIQREQEKLCGAKHEGIAQNISQVNAAIKDMNIKIQSVYDLLLKLAVAKE